MGTKYGCTATEFWATTQQQVSTMFTGALCTVLPFISTWGGFLLSTIAWMQVAIFSHVVCSVMICRAIRVPARMPWDTKSTRKWISFVSPKLPQDTLFLVGELWASLQRARCSQGMYAQWHVPGDSHCTEWCGNWSEGADTICRLAARCAGPALVDWGVH